MTELTIQKLIQELKKDLFSSSGVRDISNAPDLFLVESAEVEVEVSISYEAETGLKIMVIPAFLEGSVGAGANTTSKNIVRIKLSPIVSLEELRANIQKDAEQYKKIVEGSKVFFQGDGTE